LSAEDATELRNVSFAVALLDGEASEKAVHAIKAAEAYAAALEGE
jgi:cellobiose-specific phosphotransferase system component IIA